MRDEYDEKQAETYRRRWERVSTDDVESPIRAELPYVELKLEHPDIDPTQISELFFPDAVPYQIDVEHRIFYWRSALPSEHAPISQWDRLCATTHELAPITVGTSTVPALVSAAGAKHVVVVDGTIGGESTEAALAQYEPPKISVGQVTADAVVLDTPVGRCGIPVGKREQLDLPPQRVRIGDCEQQTCVTPQLCIRYPGRRLVYHPAPDATYALFPSFGLPLDDIPNPVPIPRTGDFLDHTVLAAAFDVELSARPYAERVLWQAFVYTAFDPHRETTLKLTQFETGQLAVLDSY